MINKVTLNGVSVPGIILDTFHYSAQFGSPGAWRLGGVYGSYIEFDYFTPSTVTISKGDVIKYYQTVDIDKYLQPTTPRDVYINDYTVTEVISGRKQTHIVAYDDTIKLNIDFSKKLASLESSFPMTVGDLANEAATLAGVTFTTNAGSPPYAGTVLNYFFVDGITVREIFGYIAEIYGGTAYCSGAGTITVDVRGFISPTGDWLYSNEYIIAPDNADYHDGSMFVYNVPYKEAGLELHPAPLYYDGVKVINSRGALLGDFYSSWTPQNIYYCTGNVLVENVYYFQNSTSWDDFANHLLTRVEPLSSWSVRPRIPVKVRLFPFIMPFRQGDVVYVADSGGSIKEFRVQSIDITSDAAVLQGYGRDDSELGYGTSYGTAAEEQTFLTAQINAIFTALDNLQPKKDVLWTNTAPTSNFGAQQVPLDESASDYDFLMFVYYWDTGNKDISTKTFPVSMLSSAGGMLDIVRLNQNRTGGRTFTLDSDTEVTFSGAQYNGGSNNAYAIPAEIIGIKL